MDNFLIEQNMVLIDKLKPGQSKKKKQKQNPSITFFAFLCASLRVIHIFLE